jgi:hypothetical protein
VIETIPKVGYRLLLRPGACLVPPRAGRRRLLVRGVAAALGLALCAALGVASRQQRTAPEPARRRLSADYVSSLGLAGRGEPNRQAIRLLQGVLRRDAGDADAWAELAQRLYLEGRYGAGGTTLVASARQAALRSLELDPEQSAALARLVVLRTEQGDLEGAFRLATRTVQRWPAASEAHFALAYVLRYGGLLELSRRECAAARASGPATPRLRSCAIAALRSGAFEEARAYLELDHGSQWVLLVEGLARLSEGRVGAAESALLRLPEDNDFRDLVGRCRARPTDPAIARRLDSIAASTAGAADPESAYVAAVFLASCGRDAAALLALKRASRGGYCTVSALESETPFRALHDLPGFAQALDIAEACRSRLLSRLGPALGPALGSTASGPDRGLVTIGP